VRTGTLRSLLPLLLNSPMPPYSLLTSEKITPLNALRLSYDKCISSLLENTRFLPIGITSELRTSQSK
jgi:hypothetical protein